MKTLIALVTAALVLMPSGQIGAQPPAPPTCEDTARTLRILAEQYATSRQRTEIEAAQTMANLLKQLDLLKAENETLKKAAKPEPAKDDKK